MHVYCRRASSATDHGDGPSSQWKPGTIYSAKVDPARLSDDPLIYHIRFNDWGEDLRIPEEDVMSRPFYEEAILGRKIRERPGGAPVHKSLHPRVIWKPRELQ